MRLVLSPEEAAHLADAPVTRHLIKWLPLGMIGEHGLPLWLDSEGLHALSVQLWLEREPVGPGNAPPVITDIVDIEVEGKSNRSLLARPFSSRAEQRLSKPKVPGSSPGAGSNG